MRNQTVASILANRQPRTISDVTAIACGYRFRSRHAGDFSDEIPTLVEARNAFTPTERAWFKRPIGAIALVIALACGTSAHAAPRTTPPAVATARAELTTARAHLKSAREADRAQRKADHAAHVAQRKAARVARLRAALAKAEGQ